MDSPSGNIAQRTVDHSLALESTDAGKHPTLDFHREMTFAGAIVAGVTAMVGAVVDDGEVGGGKLLREQSFDFSGKWS